MKHTPEPWRVVNKIDVQSGPQGCLAYVSTAGARGRTLEEAQANARRIVACVNACVGIPTEALENNVVAELVAALREAEPCVGQCVRDGNPFVSPVLARVRALLDHCQGAQP